MHPMGRIARCFFVALSALIVCLPLRATIVSSALTGRVLVGNQPSAGVTVTITLRTANRSYTTITNARGSYWLGALSPGEYDVSFYRTGLTSLSRPVTIELGRVARADARLEVSADEESVTSTAITVSVANTTAITTHFSADELDRVPLRRNVRTAETLSPVVPGSEAIVDGAVLSYPLLLGEESLDETTVVRGAQAIELDRIGSSVIVAQTRSGHDALLFALRGTYASVEDGDGGLTFEGASGGRIVPDRLWFFASAFGGEAADLGLDEWRGLTAKLTSQPTESHQLELAHIDAKGEAGGFQFGDVATSLRYAGVLSPSFTAQAMASRTESETPFGTFDDDAVSVKLAYRIADHVVSAGGNRVDSWRNGDADSVFVGDRWASGRWAVDAGTRWQDEQAFTRIAVAFDLRSAQGSHAIVGSWGEYLAWPEPIVAPRTARMRVTSIGYTSSLESSGTARIDLFHYEGAREMEQVQTDVRYRLFDRFEAGGTYVYTRTDESSLISELIPEHLLTARVGLQLPLGGHEFSSMVLGRYDGSTWVTDLGVRYEIPVRSMSVTVAGDAMNLSNAEALRGTPELLPRGVRIWLRVSR